MRTAPSPLVRRVVAGGVGVAVTAAITFAGATTAEAVNTSCDSGLCRAVFVYSGLPESWEVPAGVTSITAVVEGGSGGHAMNDGTFFGGSHGAGGLGGTVRATLPVQPGDELALVVGGAGQDGVSDANTYAPGDTEAADSPEKGLPPARTRAVAAVAAASSSPMQVHC